MKRVLAILFVLATLPSFAARSFNGTTQGILTSTCCANPGGGGSAVSMSAWFKVTSTGGCYCTVAEWKNDQFPGFYNQGLAINAGGHYSAFFCGDNTNTTCGTVTGGAVTLNVWHQMGMTWDASSHLLRIYVDGTQASSTTVMATISNGNLPLGAGAGYIGGCCDTFLTGSVAEVASWAVLLSPLEMAALAHGTPPSLVRPSVTSGGQTLFIYWPMHGLGTGEDNFTNIISTPQGGNLQGSPPQAPHCPCGMPTGEGH